jgi:HlyD family secretion protein
VRRIPSWVVPLVIIGGFTLLFLALFRDRLLPAPDVETGLVLATTSAPDTGAVKTSSTGAMVFQASGWIEPDPLPIKATALIDGVIDAVHVLEGDAVAKGAPLASLDDADARLAFAAAEQKLGMLKAVRDTQIASIAAARKKYESALAIVKAALTLQDEASDQHTRLSTLPKGTVPESNVVSARLRLDRERLQRIAAEADGGAAQAEIARMEIETKVREAEVRMAEVELSQAKLALDRARITSPVTGRVLRLLAAPGQKKRLGMDDLDSSTIAILYQPDKLQVRVDVPLADAAGLSIGQQAKIRCSFIPDKVFTGEVTRITGEADVQRNTLQAKVRILDPIETLRPEMLCRIEFLGNTAAAPGPAAGSLAMWIPQAALSDGFAWVCDPETQRVSKRAVNSSGEIRDGFVRISSGLRAGENVIIAPQNLREGQRVNSVLKKP